ncbi:hypothetical protein P8C59_004169 [Phyllachora maydis]|uniref:Association with the SNF1 complex (ASC) domain-containing protein n=1 Tax=Phyllachora maydis TaxID=1825666 RepID=A0AAD9I3I2_9PEZI|nr:hypothetical protein P8C59_004169 [Phyllachora maydis]
MSYITRPPRLPLPIEEEVHTPGSPIVAPTDLGEPLEDVNVLNPESLPRRSSTLSSSTIDEEDAEELRVDKTRPTVPTRLEWLRGGDKVYVTGTIFHWNRKTRLHPVEGRPGVFTTTINILPDFGNNLVNYIEVSPDDVPSTQPETAGAASRGKDLDTAAEGEAKRPHFREVPPNDMFSYSIPSYLQDFDQPEDSQPYSSALSAIEKLPNPPTLPSFLGKPILNHATLIKDDNSVLNMPNHTVLNHLMTSSIKNNILAVSGTTRYKDKYVTTIVYKPTSVDGN